jgi:hypothetical protein
VCQGDLCEVAVGAAVDIGNGDDVRAGRERLQDVGCGGRAGAVGERIVGVLERCDCAFEVVAGGEERLALLSQLFGGAQGKRSVPIGVRRARVLVLTDGLSNRSLRVRGGQGNLALSVSAYSRLDNMCTYSLNHSTGDRVVRAAGVHCEGAEPVRRGGRARRGVNRVFGERHSE